jgi:hypothetical protein
MDKDYADETAIYVQLSIHPLSGSRQLTWWTMNDDVHKKSMATATVVWRTRKCLALQRTGDRWESPSLSSVHGSSLQVSGKWANFDYFDSKSYHVKTIHLAPSAVPETHAYLVFLSLLLQIIQASCSPLYSHECSGQTVISYEW